MKTLIDKVQEISCYTEGYGDCHEAVMDITKDKDGNWISVDDFQDFIRKLKIAFVHGTSWESKFVNKTIDDLSGFALHELNDGDKN